MLASGCKLQGFKIVRLLTGFRRRDLAFQSGASWRSSAAYVVLSSVQTVSFRVAAWADSFDGTVVECKRTVLQVRYAEFQIRAGYDF